MKKILSLLAVALLFAMPVRAEEKPASPVVATPAPDPTKIPVLQKIKEKAGPAGKDLAFDYLGNRFGFDAWLISGKGIMQVVYTPASGDAAVIGGLLVGPEGQDANAELQKNFIKQNPQRAHDIFVLAHGTEQGVPGKASTSTPATAPATASADMLWEQMGHLGLVTYGAKPDAPAVYAVLDPNQAESKQLWARLLPLAESGQIILHAIPLALVSADGVMEIAQVLGSAHPDQSWKDLMAGTPDKLPQTPDPKGVAGLKDNVTFAQGLNLRQLPFIVYRQAGKGTVRAVKGLPKDWAILLKDIGMTDDKSHKAD